VQIPVLIEPVANNGYRAKCGEPLPLSADGTTPDEAVRNLRAAMDLQLKNGKRLVSVQMADGDNPWLAMAGTVDPNDPLTKEWKEAMAAYRQQVDDDPSRP
jgi:predicted RNase H-like HicB family nuclease